MESVTYILRIFFFCGVFAQAAGFAGDVVAQAEQLPTAAELHRRFIENNGGRTNIQELKSLVIDARIIEAEGQTVEFKFYRKRPEMMRMRYYLPQYTLETLYDGRNGWRLMTSLNSGETLQEELSEAQLEVLRASSSIEGPFSR